MRSKVEEILGIKVEVSFAETFKQLDVKGKLDQRTIYRLLALILDHLEGSQKAPEAPKAPIGEIKIPLYNPDTEDVTIEVREEGNQKVPYTIHAQEISHFTPVVADLMKKAIANQLINKRGIKTNYEDEYTAALLEIAVEL